MLTTKTEITIEPLSTWLMRCLPADQANYATYYAIFEQLPDGSLLCGLSDLEPGYDTPAFQQASSRVQHLFNLMNRLARHYRPPYCASTLSASDFVDIPQFPYLFNVRSLSLVWAFPKPPGPLKYLSGPNFIEEGEYGLFTNPHPVLTQVAPTLNALPRRKSQTTSFSTQKNVLAQTIRQLKNNRDNGALKILDIGCGYGHLLIDLATRFSSDQFYGLDCNDNLLNLLETEIQQAKIHNIRLIHQTISNHPTLKKRLAAATKTLNFDLIICNAMIGHLPDPKAFIRLLSDLLAPKGQIFVGGIPNTDAFRFKFGCNSGDLQKYTHCHFFSTQKWLELVQAYGFKFSPVSIPAIRPESSTVFWEECFPTLVQGTWWFFGRPLPDTRSFESVFKDGKVPSIDLARPSSGGYSAIQENLKLYRLYPVYEDYIAQQTLHCLARLGQGADAQQTLDKFQNALFDTLILGKPQPQLTEPRQDPKTLLHLVQDLETQVKPLYTLNGFLNKC